MKQLKIGARWVAFLPVAFVAAWLAWVLSKFVNSMTGGWLHPVVERGAIVALASATMGAAFVFAGAKTAPAYRTMVAYFLGVLGLVIMAAFSGSQVSARTAALSRRGINPARERCVQFCDLHRPATATNLKITCSLTGSVR